MAYPLVVTESASVVSGNTVYRFYVQLENPTDRVSAIYGESGASLSVQTPQGAFNSPLNTSWNASGLNPAFFGAFPEMIDDSYATIGLNGPASMAQSGAEDPLLIEGDVPVINSFFVTDGAQGFNVNSAVGASWFILPSATNGLPDGDLRVLVMQVTTTGSVSGQLNYQVFPLGEGSNDERVSVAFDGAGTFGGSSGGLKPPAMLAAATVGQAVAQIWITLLQHICRSNFGGFVLGDSRPHPRFCQRKHSD